MHQRGLCKQEIYTNDPSTVAGRFSKIYVADRMQIHERTIQNGNFAEGGATCFPRVKYLPHLVANGFTWKPSLTCLADRLVGQTGVNGASEASWVDAPPREGAR